MPNQVKNLATLCTEEPWMDVLGSGNKKIFAVGFTAGLVDSLAELGFSSTANPNFIETHVVKIKLFRKNMLDESDLPSPKEFVFDLSKFA